MGRPQSRAAKWLESQPQYDGIPVIAIRLMRLYFIREGEDGPIKIGIAESPERRRHGLQGGNPRRLHILKSLPAGHFGAAIATERRWHRAFAAERLEGEWFRACDRLLEAISRGEP